MLQPGHGRRATVPLVVLLTLALYLPASAAHELERIAQRTAAAVVYLHDRLNNALVHAAHDRAVAALLLDAGCDARLREVVERTLIGLQGLLPVEQATVTDTRGRLRAHVLRGYTESARCGAPSLPEAVPDGNTPVASATARRWVVRNSAPVHAAGQLVGTVTSEADLALFRRTLPRTLAAGVRVQVVDADGFVVADSQRSTDTHLRPDTLRPEHYFERLPPELMAPATQRWQDDDGRVRRVTHAAAGSWSVLASAPE